MLKCGSVQAGNYSTLIRLFVQTFLKKFWESAEIHLLQSAFLPEIQTLKVMLQQQIKTAIKLSINKTSKQA